MAVELQICDACSETKLPRHAVLRGPTDARTMILTTQAEAVSCIRQLRRERRVNASSISAWRAAVRALPKDKTERDAICQQRGIHADIPCVSE